MNQNIITKAFLLLLISYPVFVASILHPRLSLASLSSRRILFCSFLCNQFCLISNVWSWQTRALHVFPFFVEPSPNSFSSHLILPQRDAVSCSTILDMILWGRGFFFAREKLLSHHKMVMEIIINTMFQFY